MTKKLATLVAVLGITMTVGACASELSPKVKKDIQERMESKHPRMQSCYEESLESNSSTSGTMTLKFTVNKKGKFEKAKVTKNTIGDSSLEECVVAETEKLKLKKKNKSPVLVTYKLKFKPNN